MVILQNGGNQRGGQNYCDHLYHQDYRAEASVRTVYKGINAFRRKSSQTLFSGSYWSMYLQQIESTNRKRVSQVM